MMVLVCIQGCGALKKVPGEVTKMERVVIEVERVRVDTVSVPLPVEKEGRFVDWNDTLWMDTSIAEAWACVDSLDNMLIGEIRNKEGELQKEVFIREKTVMKDSLVYVDRVVPKEVEKEVKVVPGWCWRLLFCNMLILIYLIYKIYRKFRK